MDGENFRTTASRMTGPTPQAVANRLPGPQAEADDAIRQT